MAIVPQWQTVQQTNIHITIIPNKQKGIKIAVGSWDMVPKY